MSEREYTYAELDEQGNVLGLLSSTVPPDEAVALDAELDPPRTLVEWPGHDGPYHHHRYSAGRWVKATDEHRRRLDRQITEAQAELQAQVADLERRRAEDERFVQLRDAESLTPQETTELVQLIARRG